MYSAVLKHLHRLLVHLGSDGLLHHRFDALSRDYPESYVFGHAFVSPITAFLIC